MSVRVDAALVHISGLTWLGAGMAACLRSAPHLLSCLCSAPHLLSCLCSAPHLLSCLLSCFSGLPSMSPFKLLVDKVSFNVALVLPTLQLGAAMKWVDSGGREGGYRPVIDWSDLYLCLCCHLVFTGCQSCCFPLRLVSKKDPREFRLTHNLFS